MRADIIIIGAGASGLMAAYGAAKKSLDTGRDLQVTVLEKMPRPARKMMITGKGRCNFTNLKDWNEFSGHIRTNPNFVKPSFYNFPPAKVVDFFEEFGLGTVIERGDRAFPASYHASDVVDTLVNACLGMGVKIETGCDVAHVEFGCQGFVVEVSDGRKYSCPKLIIATGGLSYPSTGSTGDGYRWAGDAGHRICPCFPSLTALVPKGYKIEGRMHIDRATPLSEIGNSLCGIQLKNVSVTLEVEGNDVQNEFGDIDFTDGGIEGPIGFLLSRKAVKSLVNGSRASLVLDMKPGIPLQEITSRVESLWTEIDRDPRSARLYEKEKCRILLGKLMPWNLIPAFRLLHPEILTVERRGRSGAKVWVNLSQIALALKHWRFEIAGYVGYERAVVTAGGVNTEEVFPKTLESRLLPGLHFCGEVLDIDSDTGGYNLQTAFCTGMLAGLSAASKL